MEDDSTRQTASTTLGSIRKKGSVCLHHSRYFQSRSFSCTVSLYSGSMLRGRQQSMRRQLQVHRHHHTLCNSTQEYVSSTNATRKRTKAPTPKRNRLDQNTQQHSTKCTPGELEHQRLLLAIRSKAARFWLLGRRTNGMHHRNLLTCTTK
jgi:hypothetical protein